MKLNSLLFDKLAFTRLGIKNDNEIEINFSVNIGVNISDDNIKKITIGIIGNKKDEYTVEVQASGLFEYEGDATESIIQQNAVAIVMPYVRSQLTLLTSQPGVEPIVMPPFNIIEMLKAQSSN
uniref:protein-export chaperone SecB n=1 Tax=Lachnospira eligens TaxID=39485 RepID=UPI003FEECDA9